MRGATRFDAVKYFLDGISIHAPHAGRDTGAFTEDGKVEKFQSTRPMRGATGDYNRDIFADAISIHAPHAGRDGGAARPRWYP